MLAKHVLAAAVCVIALTATAYAGEGNGEPFPGPNAVVRESVQNPRYTMGGDAPFNYFYAAKPTPMSDYQAAKGANQDPYPFKMNGQVIRVEPAPPSAFVSGPQSGNHG